MAGYYAYISGAANIRTNFNPKDSYSTLRKTLVLHYNGDITTTATSNVYVWRQTDGNWFSFEQGAFQQYLNIGTTTYVTGVNNISGNRRNWNTSGFSKTAKFRLYDGSASLFFSNGAAQVSGDFSGTLPEGFVFFPSSYASNLQMYFYELKVYSPSTTLLYDFVPDLSGSTKGILDKVSGNFFAATDQTKITLYALDSISTDVTAITGTYEASSYTVNLSSDEAWTATTIPSWVSLSTTAGTSGTTQITVSFPKNSAYSQRTGTIVFTDSEDNTCEVECTQEKHPLFIPQDIYRSGEQVEKLYRSGDEVTKMYRSGELIYQCLNPPTP